MNRKSLHRLFWKVCRNQTAYWASTDTQHPDCSCGCKWFVCLLYMGDWGVCACPESPRAGLLTFEHMGCGHFKRGKSPEESIIKKGDAT